MEATANHSDEKGVDQRRDFDRMDLLSLQGIASRIAARFDAVMALHAKRSATNDYMAPYTYDYCVECRQTWPCATVQAALTGGSGQA